MCFKPMNIDSLKEKVAGINSDFYARYVVNLEDKKIPSILCYIDISELSLSLRFTRGGQLSKSKIWDDVKVIGIKYPPLTIIYETNSEVPDIADLANLFEFNSSIKYAENMTLISELREITFGYINKIKSANILSSKLQWDKLLKIGERFVPALLLSSNRLCLDGNKTL